jgi:hypothetical protein
VDVAGCFPNLESVSLVLQGKRPCPSDGFRIAIGLEIPSPENPTVTVKQVASVRSGHSLRLITDFGEPVAENWNYHDGNFGRNSGEPRIGIHRPAPIP